MTTPRDFSDGLVRHGFVLPSTERGLQGYGPAFERILQGFNTFVSDATRDDQAEPLTFPPVLPRTVIEQVGYLGNFPHLVGAVHGFSGSDALARDMAQRADHGKPWEDLLTPTGLMLTPAACYPVYPMFSGLLADTGRLVTLTGWVYRHEPSDEATRLQAFRMREFIRVGRAGDVIAWRDAWLFRALDLLRTLGLDARSEVASDPFFGRAGKMMKASQIDQKLKFEIVVPVLSDAPPTAVCSFNWHQDHFSSVFGIHHADGAPASTACLGFGLERVTLALIKTHGFDVGAWPQNVRDALTL